MKGLEELDILLRQFGQIPTDAATQINAACEQALPMFHDAVTDLESFKIAVTRLYQRTMFGRELPEQLPDDINWCASRHLRPYASAVYERYFKLKLDGGEAGFLRNYIAELTTQSEESRADWHLGQFIVVYKELTIEEQIALGHAYVERVRPLFVPGKWISPYFLDSTLREHWRLWARFKEAIAAAADSV